MKGLRGTGVALVTPFTPKGTVDTVGLDRLVRFVSEQGADYLVALATTSEAVTLTLEERAMVLHQIKKSNADRLPLVLGLGGNNTVEVVRQLQEVDSEGITALLSVTPYYNRPSQEGLYAHYRVLAEESPLPLILYNVPGRTGVNLTAETTLRLAHDFSNIVGIKEASGNLMQAAYILRDRPRGFLVISGEDNLALPLLALGGDGVISVAANVFPEVFCHMVHLALEGDFSAATPLHLRLIEAVDALFAEGNPVGVKKALYIRGLIADTLRLPLVSGSSTLEVRMREIFATHLLF